MREQHHWYVGVLATADRRFRLRCDILHTGEPIDASTIAMVERSQLERALERMLHAEAPGYLIAHPFWAQSASCIFQGPFNEATYRDEWAAPVAEGPLSTDRLPFDSGKDETGC